MVTAENCADILRSKTRGVRREYAKHILRIAKRVTAYRCAGRDCGVATQRIKEIRRI